MRALILSAALLLFAAGLTAQTAFMGELKGGYTFDPGPDTLTNADTFTYTLSADLNSGYDYIWQIDVDSLSGTTSATATVQVTACDTCTTAPWITQHTMTVPAQATYDTLVTGFLYTTRQRMQVISSGTQSTRIRPYAILKKRQ